MSQTLVVIGATGQQGGSVIESVLKDAELSKIYKIRAVTRDPISGSAQKLSQQGVEVVKGDVDDKNSIHSAFKGADTAFVATVGQYEDPGYEEKAGKQLADIAVAEGIKYYIFSTLPNVTELSNGKYDKVTGFDGKAHVESYIRALPIKSAFFAPGSFMQNLQSISAPRSMGDGTYAIMRHVSPQTKLPLIDTADDTGKFVASILADPDKYEGKVFCSATKLYSLEEQADIISKASGKTVIYKQIPTETMASFLPPQMRDGLIQMMLYQQDYGYYGAETEELVKWAVDNAREKPNTLEEYLAAHPLNLQ